MNHIKGYHYLSKGGESSKMSSIGRMVDNVVMGIIAVVIFILVGVALGPTVIAAVADINATTLSGIPLASVIVLLGTYFPAFYYLALVLGGISAIWAIVKFRD